MLDIRNVIAEVSDPLPKPNPIDFLSTNMKFSLAEDANALYSPRKSPWHKACLDWFTDDVTQEIFIIAGAQTSKSTLIIGSMLYAIANDSGPMLLILSDEITTKQFCDRFSVTLERSLPKLFNKDFSKDYGGLIGNSKLYLAWASSESKLRSKPIKYVFADETSLYRHSLSFISERTTNFKNRKLIFATTPTSESEQTWSLANDTAQRYSMLYPCPNCATLNSLDFDNLKYNHCRTALDKWDYDRVEHETIYKFPCCQLELEQKYQEEILQTGIAVTDKEHRSPKRKSLLLSCLDSSQKTWGQAARKCLESKHSLEDSRNFQTQWLARPYVPKLDSLKSADVRARKSDQFKTNIAPQDTLQLLCACDIQASGIIYGVVRAYLSDERSVLISAFKLVETDIKALLERLYHEVINKTWQWDNHNDGLRMNSTTIDSGDGNVTSLIYDFCTKYRNRCYPLKGIGANAKEPYKVSYVDTYPNSQLRIVPTLPLYVIKTEHYREVVISNYNQEVNKPFSLLVTSEIPDEYYEHLESWKQDKTKTGIKWARDNSKREDWLDAECYCAALHDIHKQKIQTQEIVKRNTKPVQNLGWNLNTSEIRTRY